jgi:transcriptional regulator with XRE-family HTH domain
MSADDLALIRSFGAGVRQLREARDWSQEQLAEQAGLNRSYVGEIERGDVSVSLCTVAKLAHAFGLAPSALVSRSETTGVA